MDQLFSIRDANSQDMDLLNWYAGNEGMGKLPGPMQVRVAVNADNEPIGFCRLQASAAGVFYVNPIVVYAPWRGFGVGRALIEDARQRAGELRLISRGQSAGFYRKLGFTEMAWEMADLEAASEDCENCPMREGCKPVPMRLE